jgi:hypothetical protein
MANSKEKSFNNIISSTLSLITVLFKDIFDTVNIHNTIIHCDNTHYPYPSISLVNKTETFAEFVYKGGVIKKDEYSTPIKIIEVVRDFLCLWLLGILQKYALYFG